jgi:cysteine synthase A
LGAAVLTTLSPALLRPPLRTPLVPAEFGWIRPEAWQLSGSVKYRMVYDKLRRAILSGAVAPHSILTEVTSRSTGVALAYAGKQLGLVVELHLYSTASHFKRIRMREFGARLMVHPPETPMSELLNQASRADAWPLNQYDRDSTVGAYAELAEEAIEQLRLSEAAPEWFVCPVGTGGVIQGVGKRLRDAFPKIKILAVEPEPGAAIDGIRNTSEFNLGAADPYDPHFADECRRVPAPRIRIDLKGVLLGESASAAWLLAMEMGLRKVFMIAAD